jgi:poly [ADP-ribose] polymerase 10/14/15
MAFLITAEPFAIDPVTIGGILVPANILLAALAMAWQWNEAKRQIELEKQKQALKQAAEDLAAANVTMSDQLRGLSNAAVGLVVGLKTLSVSMRRVTMRDKWGGKALDEMNSAEMAAAASATGLETRGAKDQAEVQRLLAVAEAADARGEKLAEWCWQEDDARVANHDPATVRTPNWILYADVVAAQLEERWQVFSAGGAGDASKVEIDVNGRVRSTSGGKAFGGETGTAYVIDFASMAQKNLKSGYSRKVRREAMRSGDGGAADKGDVELGLMTSLFSPPTKSTKLKVAAAPVGEPSEITISVTVPPGSPGTFEATAPDGRVVQIATPPGVPAGTTLVVKVPTSDEQSTSVSLDRALDRLKPLGDDDGGVPEFPADLMDPGPGLEPEPILLIKAGMLVQVQDKRDDGWWYGFALEAASDADDAVVAAPEIPLKQMAEALKKDLESGEGAALYTTTSIACIVEGACRKYGVDVDANALLKSKAKAAYGAMCDRAAEDRNDTGAGWFPSSFVGLPTPKQLSRLQALLSRSVGGTPPGNAVNDVLSPPQTWQEPPAGARGGAVQFVPVDAQSAEYSQVLSAFNKELKGNANILGVERIQNRALWQSYAVKCQTLRLREEDRRRDNLGAIAADEIERKWFFHGSDADTLVNKISAQGFNRSFAGKNATMFGKGVYFARGSYYSARTTYSKPDAQGVQRMLLCRVAVGAYCKGEKDRMIPDERDTGKGVLFDTTVENLADPFIFVTYHDAQAYLEYIVKFNNYTGGS